MKEVADDFAAQHRVFRKALLIIQPAWKHLTVEGDRAIAWLRIRTSCRTFPHDDLPAPYRMVRRWNGRRCGISMSMAANLENGIPGQRCCPDEYRGVRCLVD